MVQTMAASIEAMMQHKIDAIKVTFFEDSLRNMVIHLNIIWTVNWFFVNGF